jgi:Zn-dependent oligopeptidase
LQVKKFLEDVSDKITPLAEKELEHLKQLKVSQSWSHLVACFKNSNFSEGMQV